MPRLEHRGARLDRAILLLCPPAFRREFALEMAQDVDAALDEMPLDIDVASSLPSGRRTAAIWREQKALILLIGVVLVVIASTILSTFWFSQPLLPRHRRRRLRRLDIPHLLSKIRCRTKTSRSGCQPTERLIGRVAAYTRAKTFADGSKALRYAV